MGCGLLNRHAQACGASDFERTGHYLSCSSRSSSQLPGPRSASARQRVLHIRESVGHHSHDSGVLAQLRGDNFVEGICRGVMVVVIFVHIWEDAEKWNAFFGHWHDVGNSGWLRALLKYSCADAAEDHLHRLQSFGRGFTHFCYEAERMGGSNVTLDGCDVVFEVATVIFSVLGATGAIGLFIHPCNNSQRALWAEV